MALPEAPVDELTHYPLPFVPDPNLPPMPAYGDKDYDRDVANLHHPVFRHYEVEGFGAGGKAARDSGLQWAWRSQHDRFHRTWGGLGEHMPRTEAAQFRTTLFGVMGHTAGHAISFDRPDPRVVKLNNRQRELLRQQRILGNDGARVRRFLLDYTFKQGAPGVDPELVDRFLWLAQQPNVKSTRLTALADVIMHQIIDPSVTPGLEQIYAFSRSHNLVRPGLPKRLGTLIRREIISGFSNPRALVRKMVDKCEELKQAPEFAASSA
jgi:hypothetical protein